MQLGMGYTFKHWYLRLFKEKAAEKCFHGSGQLVKEVLNNIFFLSSDQSGFHQWLRFLNRRHQSGRVASSDVCYPWPTGPLLTSAQPTISSTDVYSCLHEEGRGRETSSLVICFHVQVLMSPGTRLCCCEYNIQ